MDKDAKNEPHLLINDIEENARNNIIKLDQKLKGLRAEVKAKMRARDLVPEEQQDVIQGLNALLVEINQAINGIQTLVALVVEDNHESITALLQSDELKQINTLISENLEKIIKIKNEF